MIFRGSFTKCLYCVAMDNLWNFISFFRDVIESSEKVSVILESWKLKYGDEATVVRLVSGIQMMDLQEVVDEFYREFQIPRKVKAKKQKSE